MESRNIFSSFARDVVSKLQKRFLALSALSALCAITDGFRLLLAFLLLPFMGIGLEEANNSFLDVAQNSLLALGVPYEFLPVSLIVIFAFGVQAVLSIAQSWYQGSYTNFYTLRWRQDLFLALSRARWSYFVQISRGELTNALSQETSRLTIALTKFLLLISNGLVAVAYLGASLLVSVEATALATVIGFVVALFNWLLVGRLMGHAREIVKGNKQTMVLAQEFLSNIKVIKSAPRGFSISCLVEEPLRRIFHNERIGFLLPNVSKIAAEFFVIVVLIVAIAAAAHLQVDIPSTELLLVLVLFMRAYGKLTITMNTAQQMIVQLPAFEYVSDLHRQLRDHEEALWSDGEILGPKDLSAGISINNLTKKYGTKFALDNVSVELPFCSITALVGPSGSGKTTLVDTILRLISADAGSISVGGRNADSFNVQSWRSCCSYVTQELTLVNGTLAENIKLFHPDASRQDVQGAAELAQAAEFIDRLPDGYDTFVGEMGMKLSGGQRQRIALARALLDNAPILILDEATSALDVQAEQRIVAALENLRKDKIVLIIAHRLSTVRCADQILVLSDGRLIEQGDWSSLMVEDGVFADMWRRMASDAA